MENTHILVKEEISNYNISQLKQLPKKDTQIISYIEETFIEKEYLKEEISNYKNENNRLKKENEELRKENNSKRLYKDYILGIDKIMNQLPPTKDYSKKLELIQRFIDFSLALFNILDKIPLNKSARFGYSERNLFIRYCFKISYDEVLRQISDLNKGINDIGDIPKEGISIANISNIRTKDDLCLKVLKKLANLD